MTPWVWFMIAGLAAAAGSALLAADRGQQNARQRERRRWAALRGWRFVPSDPVIAQHWHHGVIAGAGLARNLVTGSLFTPVGRRLVQVFDHERDGQILHVVVAVQRRVHDGDLVLQLCLPEGLLTPSPDLTTLGRVGDRIALTSDPDQARPLVSTEFVFAANALGGDIPVAWLEQDWVLAAAPCAVTPSRLERLLRALDELADLLDIAVADYTEVAEYADEAEYADNTADPTEIANLDELSSWSTNDRQTESLRS